ncbi:MAG: hypothetical protein IPQ08_12735 [Chitinophagaceae bacterium]|nr:hypothetical protein [Chitinophagaceae bacterium]
MIKLLDIQRKEERSIGSGTRYATPDLSPMEGCVAAVRNHENGNNQVDILDAKGWFIEICYAYRRGGDA